MFAESRRRIDAQYVAKFLTRIDFVANQARLICNASKSGNDEERDAGIARRRLHFLPAGGRFGRQSLHSTDQIGANVNQICWLFEYGFDAVAPVVVRNTEFFVKFE